jgi:hypothetical protein
MGIETIIGAAVPAAIGAFGASSAADTTAQAAQQSADVQKYIFDQSVALQQPFYQTGVAASNELAALYGLAPAPAPATQPTAATYIPGQPTIPPGTQPTTGQILVPPGFIPAPADQPEFAGTYYNPNTGVMYDPSIDYQTQLQQDLNDLKNQDLLSATDLQNLQSSPTAQLALFQQTIGGPVQAQIPVTPITTAPTEPGLTPAEQQQNTAEQQQAAIDRFYASPEYQVGYQSAVDLGTEQLNKIAAASGTYMSGGQAESLAGYGNQLASQSYGNYVNQLNSMAGYGQTAAGQQQAAGQNYAANAGNAYMAAGQAQAAGTLGMTNTAIDAINAFNTPNYGAPSYGAYAAPTYSTPAGPVSQSTGYLPTNMTLGYYGG